MIVGQLYSVAVAGRTCGPAEAGQRARADVTGQIPCPTGAGRA
jgi:hypothetical protein